MWFRELKAAFESSMAYDKAQADGLPVPSNPFVDPSRVLGHLPPAVEDSVLQLFRTLDQTGAGYITSPQLLRIGPMLHPWWAKAEDYKATLLFHPQQKSIQPYP